MDFIAGLIIGTILMMGITTIKLSNKAINNSIDTQPEFRPIATQKEIENVREALSAVIKINIRLYKLVDYWKREALKNAAKLGEIKIKAVEFKEKWEK